MPSSAQEVPSKSPPGESFAFPPVAPAARRVPRVLVLAAAVLGVGIVIGVTLLATRWSGAQTVAGSFTVAQPVAILEHQMAIQGLTADTEVEILLDFVDGQVPESMRDCSSLPRGLSDLGAGTQVTAEDAAGSLLAVGHLEGGELDIVGCHFTFSMELPRADLYRFQVANRGTVAYSYQDLADNDWKLALKL